MPRIGYTRTWCGTCKDFTFHHKPWEEEFQCKVCKDTSATYKLSDIPEDKLKEQIQRWKDWKRRKSGEQSTNILSMLVGMITPDEPFNTIDIYEDSMGYEAMLKEAKEKHAAERQVQIDAYNALKDKCKGLSRNDKCSCNSGLKFKNCCLIKLK